MTIRIQYKKPNTAKINLQEFLNGRRGNEIQEILNSPLSWVQGAQRLLLAHIWN